MNKDFGDKEKWALGPQGSLPFVVGLVTDEVGFV